ncbi:MAG TPA: glycosyltransferase [Azospirillaceae bacterium]|nr:glycosyltransferase [Azospirillaceae bacterium]
MKIALIDPSMFTWPYDSELATGLRTLGHEVRLYGRPVGPKEGGAGDPLLVPHFYRWLGRAERLPKPVVRVLKGLAHAGGLVRLVADLKAWAPDVIHFQWAPLPMVDRLFLPALKRIAPVVLTVHDSNPFNGNPSSRLQSLGAHAILGDVDRLIVHTAQAAGRLIRLGIPEARIACIPHGLLHAGPAPDASYPANDDGRVVLLQFGKIKPYKGVDVLIRAVGLLPPEVRRRALVKVVGKPEMDMAPLKSLVDELGVADAVEFTLGFIPDEAMMDLFRESAAVVFPYRDIDTSGVLMAAMVAGRPIVASSIGSFAELLEEGRHGHLVPRDDPNALAFALEAIITHPERRRAMALAVRGLTAAIPSWTDIARRTEALYHSLHHEERPCLDLSSASSSRTSTTNAM